MKPPTPAAVARVREAMRKVEQAQALLAEASGELSSICRGADLQAKTMKLYDKVHAHWYVLSEARDRDGMRLDSEDP